MQIYTYLYVFQQLQACYWMNKTGKERVQALADILHSALCCHSNETNPPNNVQLERTPYHSPNLHPGPCSSKVGKKIHDGHEASKTGVTRVRSKSIISQTACHITVKFCTVSSRCLANIWCKFHQILRWLSWSHLLNWHGMTPYRISSNTTAP